MFQGNLQPQKSGGIFFTFFNSRYCCKGVWVFYSCVNLSLFYHSEPTVFTVIFFPFVCKLCFSSVLFFSLCSKFLIFLSFVPSVLHSMQLHRTVLLSSLFKRIILLNWTILQQDEQSCVLTSCTQQPVLHEGGPIFYLLPKWAQKDAHWNCRSLVPVLMYNYRKLFVSLSTCITSLSNTCAGLAWDREPARCYSQENVTVHLHTDGKRRKVQGCSFAALPTVLWQL